MWAGSRRAEIRQDKGGQELPLANPTTVSSLYLHEEKGAREFDGRVEEGVKEGRKQARFTPSSV